MRAADDSRHNYDCDSGIIVIHSFNCATYTISVLSTPQQPNTRYSFNVIRTPCSVCKHFSPWPAHLIPRSYQQSNPKAFPTWSTPRVVVSLRSLSLLGQLQSESLQQTIEKSPLVTHTYCATLSRPWTTSLAATPKAGSTWATTLSNNGSSKCHHARDTGQSQQ